MKIHTLQKRIEKASRDLALEIAAFSSDPRVRNRYNENRESLVAELRLLEEILQRIADWNIAQSRGKSCLDREE